MSSRIFIVMLRRPGRNDPRSDPFWEFGSFGCTGCHGKNMLHPKNCQVRDGDRLAFIQGGLLGPRLLLITPPIKRIDHTRRRSRGCVELRWDASKKPFRYDRAPSLFELPSPRGRGLFPRLADSLAGTNRATVGAKLASRFRSRSRPPEPELAHELDSGFADAVNNAAKSDFIVRYDEALPRCDCPSSATERRRDYQQRLRKLKSNTRCRPRRTGCYR